MGRPEVVERLRANLESEQRALEKVKALQKEVLARVKQPA